MTSLAAPSQPASQPAASPAEGHQQHHGGAPGPPPPGPDHPSGGLAEVASPASRGIDSGPPRALHEPTQEQYSQSSLDKPTPPRSAPAPGTKNIHHPFAHRVQWSQNDVSLTFDIYIRQITDWHVDINEASDSFSFFAQTKDKFGATSKHQFSLQLHAKILDNPVCLPRKNKFRLIFYKQPSCFGKWPRLTSSKSDDNLVCLEECGDGGACETSGEEEEESTDENDEILEDNSFIHQEEISSLIGRATNDYDDHDYDNQHLVLNSNHQQSSSNTSHERLNRFLEDQEQYLHHRIHNTHKTDPTPSFCHRPKRASTRIEHNTSNCVDIFNPFKKREFTKPIGRPDRMARSGSESTPAGSARNKNSARNGLSLRSTYLFLYNLTMFVMFLMVFLILVIKTISNKLDDDTVQGSAFLIKILTFTQLLESIHPMLGLVPGGPFMPLLQAIGRLVVNHFLSEPTIRINAAPYAGHLFIVWSSIEIFRYSYYALRVFNIELYPLTWCRYTLFMPLYPMGGLFESMVILSAIDYYTLTGDYSVALPNAANFSFNLPIFLKIYIFLLLGPSIMQLMKYMLGQRRKQLKPKRA